MTTEALYVPPDAEEWSEVKIYIASKTAHADKWKALRDAGARIISTWIDEVGDGESADLSDLAWRCIEEAVTADLLIIYRERGEVLEGAFIEAGAALACGTPVAAIGEWDDCWSALFHHPLWSREVSFGQAVLKHRGKV